MPLVAGCQVDPQNKACSAHLGQIFAQIWTYIYIFAKRSANLGLDDQMVFTFDMYDHLITFDMYGHLITFDMYDHMIIWIWII